MLASLRHKKKQEGRRGAVHCFLSILTGLSSKSTSAGPHSAKSNSRKSAVEVQDSPRHNFLGRLGRSDPLGYTTSFVGINLVCRDHPAGLAPLGMVPPHSVDPSTLGRNIPIRTRFAQVLPQYSYSIGLLGNVTLQSCPGDQFRRKKLS